MATNDASSVEDCLNPQEIWRVLQQLTHRLDVMGVLRGNEFGEQRPYLIFTPGPGRSGESE
jgi:hypothetical protein